MTWERSRSGLKPPLLSAARCAGSEGAGKTLKSPPLEAPALHREAKHDTTVEFWPSASTYIRGSGPSARERRMPSHTPLLFGYQSFKARLTLWFYWGKRAARRHGFVGGPRKSPCIAGFRAVVRRSMPVASAQQSGRCRKPAVRQPAVSTDFPSPPMLAWPATASRPASFSTSTSRSRSMPLRSPIPIGSSSISRRSVFIFRPELGPRGGD